MKQIPHNISNVSRETLEILKKIYTANSYQLDRYADQLLWWNRKVNLVSRNASKEHVFEHIRHSLFPLALNMYKGSEHILDTGTGGGLPGIPLAIALPNCSFILNDISEKKCMVLKQIVKQLDLKNCEVRTGDVGKQVIDEPYILTTMHAFKLKDLFERTRNVNWEKAIVYKGKDYQEELKEISELDLQVHAFDLSTMHPQDFYKEKFILLVNKQ
ncbi:MAG: RsmG family class I SAM-dependent methyltransferase [Balneolales bacterium]